MRSQDNRGHWRSPMRPVADHTSPVSRSRQKPEWTHAGATVGVAGLSARQAQLHEITSGPGTLVCPSRSLRHLCDPFDWYDRDFPKSFICLSKLCQYFRSHSCLQAMHV